ncbi:hypothetical protein CEXT_113521 [Caerostris extrusa]|uniref:Uncharacterized protein n=1 Tax=Caerostris extrusa TaxID=172846 RepID=A0AAV4Y923_CAEEX|nr:hypothetical protein CEXT_113521 [Caerostris extrusa]
MSEILDYNFGTTAKEKQENTAKISHSADFNSLPFMNRTSTFLKVSIRKAIGMGTAPQERMSDCRQGMNEIPHNSYKSQGQLADNLKFQNVFQCHFCGSYQRDLKGPELPANSRNVPFKCNECIESTKLKEKIQPCPNLAEVGDERSDLKLQKKMKPSDKRYLCNLCSKRFTFKRDLF